jgi:hypothetical protein
MFVTLYNIIPTVINALFDTFYICAWFYFLSREFYKIFVYPLKQEINTLKTQHDILYEATKKLKNIIDIDSSSSSEQLKIRFNHIKSDLDSMYRAFGQRLDKIELEVSSKSYTSNHKYKYKKESDTEEDEEYEQEEDEEYEQEDEEEDEEDEEDEDEEESNIPSSNISESNSSNCILPIQNHITFPHFVMYRNNYTNKTYSKDNKLPKLLSHQLCEFLNCEIGTSMYEEDVYVDVLKLIKGNKKMTRLYKIKIVPKIRKLFGISENEDYEITPENLPKFIKPHIKQ